jgi:site-specific DNA recombinase
MASGGFAKLKTKCALRKVRMLGRLTLSILLYFAQFDREVTAEGIRDRGAASRRKGMRTGGVATFSYQVQNRKLRVDEAAAGHTR